MNRLCQSIPDSKIKYCKTVGKFDYRMLMNPAVGFDINVENAIIDRYKYYNKHQNSLFNTEDENHVNQEDMFMYQFIRNRIIEETGCELDYVVNTLISYLYTVSTTSTKKMLWACFGDVIIENLKNNVSGKICVICGRRFDPSTNNQLTCSDKCGHELDIRNKRKRRETFFGDSEKSLKCR